MTFYQNLYEIKFVNHERKKIKICDFSEKGKAFPCEGAPHVGAGDDDGGPWGGRPGGEEEEGDV